MAYYIIILCLLNGAVRSVMILLYIIYKVSILYDLVGGNYIQVEKTKLTRSFARTSLRSFFERFFFFNRPSSLRFFNWK